MVYKPTLGIGDIVATESLAPKELRMDRGSLTDGISGLQAISTFTPPEQSTLNSPRFLRDMLALVSSAQSGGQFAEQQNGGLIGMQNGGFTAEEVLRRQGLEATPEQLALFESFDPSGVGKASQQLGQGLLGMTAGQGLSSGGGGFGAQQSAIAEAVEGGQKSLEDQIQDETTAYQSQVMGTAADIIAGDGEFGKVSSYSAPTNVTTLPISDEGSVIYNGQLYTWSEDDGKYTPTGIAGGTLSTLFSSDIRLKENINLVGLSGSGINIYTFEYKDKRHGDGVYSGVMAQDVPWASFEADNGYLAVDYSKVDVSFEQVA